MAKILKGILSAFTGSIGGVTGQKRGNKVVLYSKNNIYAAECPARFKDFQAIVKVLNLLVVKVWKENLDYHVRPYYKDSAIHSVLLKYNSKNAIIDNIIHWQYVSVCRGIMECVKVVEFRAVVGTNRVDIIFDMPKNVENVLIPLNAVFIIFNEVSHKVDIFNILDVKYLLAHRLLLQNQVIGEFSRIYWYSYGGSSVSFSDSSNMRLL